MARNYNQLKNIVNQNKNKNAYFDCVKCAINYESLAIQFYLDEATKLPNTALVSILYAGTFKGKIESIELKRENTTAITTFDSRYSSVLDTKLIINGEVYYHWRVITNGHYDQQIYWEIIKNDDTK